MTETRYHRHADGAVHLEEDAESLTICQRSHVHVVVIDPADLPLPPHPRANGAVWVLRELAMLARDEDGRPATANLLDYLATQIESQCSDPTCRSALIIKGEHFFCDRPEGHDSPHGSKAAESIWGER